MFKIVTPLTTLALVLVLPGRADAWHNYGHMAVARVAWQQLEEKQKSRIHEVLKTHPHYDLYLNLDRPAEIKDTREWPFLRSAVWADWVRDPKGPGLSKEDRLAIVKTFSKPVWHYINLPYVHPDDADQFDAAALRKAILLPELDKNGEPRHILAALKHAMQLLLAAGTQDKDRAVALCWLMHLVGDLHQPLHATGLMATKARFDPPFLPPAGDQGGNLLAIKVKADDKSAMKLHFYWDALLFGPEAKFGDFDAVVAGLLRKADLQPDKLPELAKTEFLDWADESLELARTVVYKGEQGFLKARSLPANQKVDLQGLEAPVLPAGYHKAAEAVASRRMVVAGLRLANRLKEAFKV